MKRYWIAAAASAVLLAAMPVALQAAPSAGGVADLASAARGSSSVLDVAYRRCWREDGATVCRWFNGTGTRVYGYRARRDGYYPNDPDAYPIGSSHWWREMDRQGRGGRGGRG